MIQGRIFCPMDVFVTVCVEVAKMSDSVLAAAKDLAVHGNVIPEESRALHHMIQANAHLDNIEKILKIIRDEYMAPPTGPINGSGGQEAQHA